MAIINHRDKNVIFVVPPKNGCSTLRFMFGEYANLPGNMDEIDTHLQELTKLYKNKPLQKNQKIIFIYRNIFNRFLSFVNNVLHLRVTSPEWVEYENPQWDTYLKSLLNAIKINLSVETKIEDIFIFHNLLKSGRYQNDYLQSSRIPVDPHGFSQKYFLEEFLRTYIIGRVI